MAMQTPCWWLVVHGSEIITPSALAFSKLQGLTSSNNTCDSHAVGVCSVLFMNIDLIGQATCIEFWQRGLSPLIDTAFRCYCYLDAVEAHVVSIDRLR